MESAGLCGIVVPVREAETIVRQRMLQVAPEMLPRDGGTLAHITVLAPFMAPAAIDDGVLGELAGFFADITSFPFTLSGVAEFPDGTRYLAPEPAGTFRRLTRELHRLFPEFPPYSGAFDEVIPHLTVPTVPGEDLETVGRRLPIDCWAAEATLVWAAPDDTHTIATFPFGSSAA